MRTWPLNAGASGYYFIHAACVGKLKVDLTDTLMHVLIPANVDDPILELNLS